MHHWVIIKIIDKDKNEYNIDKPHKIGSAQLSGEAPGLQIRCGALKPSRVGSIPMHFRHLFYSYQIVILSVKP